MTRIAIICGSSGAGKTTIVKTILGWHFDRIRLIQSTTTRIRRPGDLPGEYEYTSPENMDYLRKNGDMIWIVPFAGNQYGTKRELVDEIFRRKEKCGIMILTPDTVALAKLYVEKRFQGSAFVKSAYICSQRDYVLVERMRGRGESEDNIRRRLIEAEEWKKWEWSFGIFDRFVRNDLEENPPAITAARELEMMIFN